MLIPQVAVPSSCIYSPQGLSVAANMKPFPPADLDSEVCTPAKQVVEPGRDPAISPSPSAYMQVRPHHAEGSYGDMQAAFQQVSRTLCAFYQHASLVFDEVTVSGYYCLYLLLAMHTFFESLPVLMLRLFCRLQAAVVVVVVSTSPVCSAATARPLSVPSRLAEMAWTAPTTVVTLSASASVTISLLKSLMHNPLLAMKAWLIRCAPASAVLICQSLRL